MSANAASSTSSSSEKKEDDVAATADAAKKDANSTNELNDDAKNNTCCPICLQEFVYPCELPCGHIFCYLCIKGSLMNQTNKCALCRRDIPADCLDKPHLKLHLLKAAPAAQQQQQQQQQHEDEDETTASAASCSLSSSCWYYEGKNGWWQYDERTSAEIEAEFKRKETLTNSQFELMIAGKIYVIDFNLNQQYRRDDPTRKRRIKRDRLEEKDVNLKGVAGISLTQLIAESSKSSAAAAAKKPKDNETDDDDDGIVKLSNKKKTKKRSTPAKKRGKRKAKK